VRQRITDVKSERIEELEAAGIDLLLLQSSPQYEEMERFAAQVIACREHRPVQQRLPVAAVS
jgi:hypothetical protein